MVNTSFNAWSWYLFWLVCMSIRREPNHLQFFPLLKICLKFDPYNFILMTQLTSDIWRVSLIGCFLRTKILIWAAANQNVTRAPSRTTSSVEEEHWERVNRRVSFYSRWFALAVSSFDIWYFYFWLSHIISFFVLFVSVYITEFVSVGSHCYRGQAAGG